MDYTRRSRHRVHVATTQGSAANVGAARDAAMRLGIAALGPSSGILLTTDADSRPRPDWLHATIAALDHADLVAGDVIRRTGRSDADQDRIEHYYARLFTLRRHVDPVEWEAPQTHHRASGANMAMRAEVYVALGGFAPLTSGEDARLVDDASRAGLRVRRDAGSVVYTSARRSGRAPGGLATALCALDRDGIGHVRVTHPADQLWQYRNHALARHAYASGDLGLLCDAIGLGTDHLLGVARDCPNGEAFAMRVVPTAPGGMRQVPLATAEIALTALLPDIAAVRAA